MEERRLEVGCGPSPRPGYEHNDINAGPHIEHVGPIHDLDFPEGTFVEIFGTGALEHLTFEQVARFLRKAVRWLVPGGTIYLDAPDMIGWLEDCIRQNRTKSSVLGALNGWCRFPGDEHKSFWTRDLLELALTTAGFEAVEATRENDRCGGPSKNDWHVCVRARRPEILRNVTDVNAQAYGWEP